MERQEFKVKRSDNFTLVDNTVLRNKDLSLKAIGLLCKMLGLPPEWDFSFNGLVSICKESKSALRSTLYELKSAGYVEIIESRNSRGQFTYDYVVYDVPKTQYLRQNLPLPDFRYTDNPNTENQPQLNTYKLIDKKDKTSQGDELTKFTKHLIKRNFLDGDEYNLNYYDNLYRDYKAAGYSDEQLFIVTNYIIKRVISNKFLDEDGNKIENKYGYFREALENNFKRFENIQDDLFDYDWLNDNLYESSKPKERER